MNKTALICGVSGQDGSYLAKFLLGKGYTVWGSSRCVQGSTSDNLRILDLLGRVKLISMAPEDFQSVYQTIKQIQPDEIYYLAGQSSVALSFDLPAETIQSVVIGTLNLLEACRAFDKNIKIYHAGSSECFGDTKDIPANENTPYNPKSPYGVAKASAKWLVDNYREAYKLYACTGILFNHESPLRHERFVTKKIISAAMRIANGSSETLTLGRMDISRDWGWAPEYVEVMWLMLQQEKPEDFVIATGKTYTLEQFVIETFTNLNLDWRNHVKQSDNLHRPTDILNSQADPERALVKLGWHAQFDMPKVVKKMIQNI
jgi:GDPmannose 4,6-dehydratase